MTYVNLSYWFASAAFACGAFLVVLVIVYVAADVTSWAIAAYQSRVIRKRIGRVVDEVTARRQALDELRRIREADARMMDDFLSSGNGHEHGGTR